MQKRLALFDQKKVFCGNKTPDERMKWTCVILRLPRTQLHSPSLPLPFGVFSPSLHSPAISIHPNTCSLTLEPKRLPGGCFQRPPALLAPQSSLGSTWAKRSQSDTISRESGGPCLSQRRGQTWLRSAMEPRKFCRMFPPPSDQPGSSLFPAQTTLQSPFSAGSASHARHC